MKTIVQTGPRSVETQDRDVPTPAADELLLEVHSAGLCGSDAHAYLYEDGYEWIQIPRIMGHEYAAIVAEVGEDVEGFTEGDHVVEEPIHECGHCFQCLNGQENVCQNFSITGLHRDGAYAEYVTVDPAHLHRVPDDVPLDHAAITEPTSIATRAVFDQSRTTPGDTVLVVGPGPIGVLTAAVANSMGARVLVAGLDQDADYRLPLVDRLGIETVNSQQSELGDIVAEFTDGIGMDVIFDTPGHHTGVTTAADHVRKGGQIVVVGLPGEESELFMTPLVRGEVDLNTSYGSTWRNFEQALRLMANGEIAVDDIVDDSFSVDEPTAAFESFLASETCKPLFSFSR